MKNKIIVSFILVATIIACMFAFVGCQTPATISSTNNGAQVVMEAGETAELPYALNGEMLKSQAITTVVKLGKDVVEIKENKKVEAKKAGTALIEVSLLNNDKADGNVLSIEVLVKNSKAVKSAQDTIGNINIDAAVSGNEEYTKVFDAAKKAWQAKIADCITEEQIAARTKEAQAALQALNAFFSEKEDVKAVISAYTVDRAKETLAARSENYKAEDIDAVLEAKSEEFEALIAKWNAAIEGADNAADLGVILAAMPGEFNAFVNDAEVRVMLKNIVGDYDMKDGDILRQLTELSENLGKTDLELQKKIDALIKTVKWQGVVLEQVSKTYTYDGSYHKTESTHDDYFVEYKLDDGTWGANEIGFKDAGTYDIRVGTTLELADGNVTIYAYSSMTILKGVLPTPVWPEITDAFVLFAQLRSIDPNDAKYGGIAGEGSVYDDEGNLYGSRVLGYFRWLEEDRYVEPVNFGGYSLELVPYKYDDAGEIVLDEEGNPVRDENWKILRQLVPVEVKPVYVTVVPKAGQWKNYDGTTATNILYDIEVYEDDARTIPVTPSEKLYNYIMNNLEGDLVLENVGGAPAKDAGNWLIEQGSLKATMDAKFYVKYEGRGITYEIKPLVIESAAIDGVMKYYDGTDTASDINKALSAAVVKAYDSEGNLVEAALVAGDVINVSVIGAKYAEKNVHENRPLDLTGATVTYTENGAAMKNYVITGTILEINGTIKARPITAINGRIKTRLYNGTDVAIYTDEEVAARVIKIQNVDGAGELAMTDAVLTAFADMAADDVHVELLANGTYVGENNTGKNVGVNKPIIFNNSEEVTSWQLVGEDAANYVYVGGIGDLDPDKTEKINYVGDIEKLKAADGFVEIVEMEATKEYDGTATLLATQLVKDGDYYKAVFKFIDVEGYEAIRNDELFVTEVTDGPDNVYWDKTNPRSDVGSHFIKIDDAASHMTIGGADADNYDWSDLIAEGTGTITKKTIRFDMSLLAEMNDRKYDRTNIAYALAKDGESDGGLKNFDETTGILSGVKFENLIAGDNFNIRILKDADGNYFNGAFADKNVENDKIAYWTNDSANGVLTWELVAADATSNVENYNFVDADLPVKGSITVIRITTVKFDLATRVYNGLDEAKMDLITGEYSEDGTYITVDPATIRAIEGAIEGDQLTIQIKADGKYNDKNAATEKEALFESWNIVGEDAGNYLFGTSFIPGELTPMTTVKGVGMVEAKKIESITITDFSVDKIRNGNAIADYNELNAKIADGTATVTFVGIIAGDDLSIILTANGTYGTLNEEGVFESAYVEGDYLVRYTQKNTTGADRNNYTVDGVDVYANGKILPKA